MTNWNKSLLYEQPITELIRLCLRFESLFAQIDYYLENEGRYNGKAALVALLEILNIADRADLKSNISKEFSRHLSNFSRLQQLPNIDHQQLAVVLDNLETAIAELNGLQGKLGQKLRENEFLMSVRIQLSNPGGACEVNNPALNFWLNQSCSLHRSHIHQWLREVESIRSTTTLMLRIIRDSSQPKSQTAYHGFYEFNLDHKQPSQLIRVQLPADSEVFPEISAGRHRLCIRFLQTDFSGRTQQITKDIIFQLTCCII